MRIKLDITGMSCEHCINHVKEALADVDGVHNIEVDLTSATIDIDDKVTEAHLKEVIDEAGYELNGIVPAN